MKFLFATLLSLCLMGCVSRPIEQANSAFEERITQIEIGMSKVKSDAIAEAKSAAADLVDKAAEKFESTGKEVISHAVHEIDETSDKKIDKVFGEVRKIMQEDIPPMVVKATDQSAEKISKRLEDTLLSTADKLAGRMGLGLKSDPNVPGGQSWWVEGGLLGTALAIAGQYYRNYTNSKKGVKRHTDEEIKKAAREELVSVLRSANIVRGTDLKLGGNSNSSATSVPVAPPNKT